MNPRALILQARGTNRDHDVMDALCLAGADPVGVPLNQLRLGKQRFADYRMLVLPGGFSYADALGAGKLLALDLQSYFADEIQAFVETGRPVIGICNGFQALVKSGILPGEGVIARRSAATTKQSQRGAEIAALAPPPLARNDIPLATLTFNAAGRFECRWVSIQPVSRACLWTRGLNESIECPVAHGEGNFQAPGPLLSTFHVQDQIALTYVCADGALAQGAYPANPNGSALDIAGLCNPAGNVLGLMPHPEDHVHPYQHPQRTRGARRGSGLPLFVNGVEYAADL
jgi:phosphoribosylformylglycinamidine synthase